jgi:hypothetical protein
MTEPEYCVVLDNGNETLYRGNKLLGKIKFREDKTVQEIYEFIERLNYFSKKTDCQF